MIKSFKLSISVFLVLFCFYSCKQKKIQKTEEVKYEESWDIFELNYLQDTIKARDRFREILREDYDLPLTPLAEGLKAEKKLNPDFKIDRFINQLPKEEIINICNLEAFDSSPFCKPYLFQKPLNSKLQEEIFVYHTADQLVRKVKLDLLSEDKMVEAQKLAELGPIKVDSLNTSNLKRIFKENGFPSLEEVGKKALYGIFVIIQHADRDPEWQKNQLKEIKKLVDLNHIDPEKYAYLVDRIKINSGEKQVYGTQFESVDYKTGIAVIHETVDSLELEKRRMDMGMMPLKMYKRIMLDVVKKFENSEYIE